MKDKLHRQSMFILMLLLLFTACGGKSLMGFEDGGAVLQDGGLLDGGQDGGTCQEPKDALCPCVCHNECQSGVCIQTSTYGSVCAPACGSCPSGPPHWACRDMQGAGGTTRSVCFPYSEMYCITCQQDTSCAAATDKCADVGGANYCLQNCAGSNTCPSGFECAAYDANGKRILQDGGLLPPPPPPVEDGGLPSDGGLPMDDGGLPMDDGGLPMDDGGLPSDGGLPMDDGGLPADGGMTAAYYLCVPTGGLCPGCVDPDNDQYGVGADCLGKDCGPPSNTIHEGAQELCDNQDNNCNGSVDEGFVLENDVNHCGACNHPCTNAHGTTSCVNSTCTPVCDNGYASCDNNPDNGCETLLSSVTECGSCSQDNQCPAGFYCDGQKCLKQLSNGGDCARSGQCLSGFCKDGKCCDTACDQACQSCATGGCMAVTSADDIPECTNENTCNASGQCRLKNFQPCTNVSGDECASGHCKADHDGTGLWCGEAPWCLHDGASFNEAAYSTICLDGANRAKCATGSWVPENCGTSACEGTCGSGPNGCAYHEKGCQGAGCFDTVIDLDSNNSYCESCGLKWAQGGETAGENCCGDDPGEFARTCEDSSANGDCGSDKTACCDAATDCVDQKGNCQTAGACHVFLASTKFSTTFERKSYCNQGVWEDPDEDASYCTASGCGHSWLENASGTGSKCCGDDPGEDFLQAYGTGRACCYNAAKLDSGMSSGAILCHEGLLYNCNGAASDHSNLAVDKATCNKIGDNYCTSASIWESAKSDGCPCVLKEECKSGFCKNDHDGLGSWCAGEVQCVHDHSIYENGTLSKDCLNDSFQAKCKDGMWDAVTCGTDHACTDYFCKEGSCDKKHFGTEKSCNEAVQCSSKEGDDGYGQAGDLRCQGYCDGTGSCDFAKNCQNCNDKDGWYNHGDLGPGCTNMSDPNAEYHEYTCKLNLCEFSKTQTTTCNSQDGYYGGGNTAGCGQDPDSQRTDYYADQSGQCQPTTSGCGKVNCDGQDFCAPVCDGAVLRKNRDCYVEANSSTCKCVYGDVMEDCAAKPTTDSDGSSTNYTTGGTVIDFTGCMSGTCTEVPYADYCVGTMVYEYGAAGAAVSGPNPYECQQLESNYCQASRFLYRDEWTCMGSPGACTDAPDSLLRDCGLSECTGTCGSTQNGCNYRARSCAPGGCSDQTHDPDTNQTYCSGCQLTWLSEASGTDSKCCGDDAGEDFEQVEGPDRKCCYNGQVLMTGQAKDSVLCHNGQLYDCKGMATDDSDLSEHKAQCDQVGSLFCTARGTWDTNCSGLHCDDFNRADSTTLGNNWTENAGDWTITSNTLLPQATFQGQWATWEGSTQTDGCVSATAHYGAGASARHIGLTARFTAAGSNVMARLEDETASGKWTSATIWSNGNLVLTQRNLDVSAAPLIQLEYSGQIVFFRIDNEHDGTWDHAFATIVTNTVAGLNGASADTSTADRPFLDDFCYSATCEPVVQPDGGMPVDGGMPYDGGMPVDGGMPTDGGPSPKYDDSN